VLRALKPGEISVEDAKKLLTQPSAALQETFGQHAKETGMTREEFQTSIEGETLLRWLPTLAEVANVAAFMASDRASALTGTFVNVTCGSRVD
jgi:enoyl-[acyl-carrier-protein] reductase (NADH)